MQSKLKILIPVLVLVIAGAGYKFAFASEPPPKTKVDGEVYVLGKEFLLNLADGRFAKLSAALVYEPEAEKEKKEEAAPPEGFGDLPQEALVRGTITDVLSGVPAGALINARRREALQRSILKRIKQRTDVHATEVIFTDVTVQ